jgi:hypothetical protein
MLGIADVELIPAGDVTPNPSSHEEFHTHAKAFEQSGGADHIFPNRALASVLLRATLLESADKLIVRGPHLAAEQSVESQLTLHRVVRRIR